MVSFGLPLSHFPNQFVKFPGDSVKLFPYPQSHFYESMIPMFPVATHKTNIFHRKSQG